MPNIILYLDIDIDTALSRTFDEGGDKFEKEGRAFYKKIVRGYEKISKWKKLEGRFVRIDANGSEEVVFERIVQALRANIIII
jgi:thymidylate kinase